MLGAIKWASAFAVMKPRFAALLLSFAIPVMAAMIEATGVKVDTETRAWLAVAVGILLNAVAADAWREMPSRLADALRDSKRAQATMVALWTALAMAILSATGWEISLDAQQWIAGALATVLAGILADTRAKLHEVDPIDGKDLE